MKIFVHAADIIHSSKDFIISEQWGSKINLEFINTYKCEKLYCLQETPFFKDLDKEEVYTKS